MCEIASTTRLFYEHSGRTLPTGRDVMCALADMGFKCQRLSEYLRRPRRFSLGQSNVIYIYFCFVTVLFE